MATRGTYKIENTILYNHWDNYPAGAANHFLNVLKDRGSLTLLDMLKCNEQVNFQFATSIFDGPAEYHYKIKQRDKGEIFITWYSITTNDQLILIDELELNEFINTNFPKCYTDPTYKEQQEIKNNEVFKLVSEYSKRVSYKTREQLEKTVNNKLSQGFNYLLNGHTGNGSSCLDEVATAIKALKDSTRIENYNKHIAPMLQKAYRHDKPDVFIIKTNSEVAAS